MAFLKQVFWKLFKAIFERLVKQVALKLLFWENYKKRHDKLCCNDNNSIDNIYIFFLFNNLIIRKRPIKNLIKKVIIIIIFLSK